MLISLAIAVTNARQRILVLALIREDPTLASKINIQKPECPALGWLLSLAATREV